MPTTTRPPEIHLFAVWEHGRPAAARIVDDIRLHFDVLAAFEVFWSVTPTARHFSRLYGQSLPPGSHKAEHCGLGPFLLLVVEDPSPQYGVRRKWGKRIVVNTNLFDAKERYRAWTGGHRVHNSTDEQESDRDLFVLLGRRREDFRSLPRGPWEGSFERVVRDPAGTDGWRSADELLTAVDLTLPYVVLPDANPSPSRVRLLVEASFDAWGVEWLLAAPEEVPLAQRGPDYPVRIAGRDCVLELHHVGDGEMPRHWQEVLLRDRVRGEGGAWVLPPAHEVATLLYALLRTGRPSADAERRLAALTADAGTPAVDWLDPAARARRLEAWARSHAAVEMPRPRRLPSPARIARLVRTRA